MWNHQLGKLIETYHNAVLSIVEKNGYPSSVRCQVSADPEHHLVTIVNPPSQAQNWRGQACLLFHEHDAHLESLRQLVLLGELEEKEGALTFSVEKFVTANSRTDSDRMPHASSPLHMLTFFWVGWRNARAYLVKRGKPWPSVPYDDITRLLADESTGS